MTEPAVQLVPPPQDDVLPIRAGMTLREAEQLLIEATLARHPNKHEAARVLGVSLKTLYNRIREYEAVRAAVAQARGVQ